MRCISPTSTIARETPLLDPIGAHREEQYLNAQLDNLKVVRDLRGVHRGARLRHVSRDHIRPLGVAGLGDEAALLDQQHLAIITIDNDRRKRDEVRATKSEWTI